METELETKMNILYSLITNIRQANIQILKNQKYILQQFRTENPHKIFKQPDELIEETNNLLGQITNGK